MGKAEVKARFEGCSVGAGNLDQGRGSGLVLTVGVLSLAEGEEGCGVGWFIGDGALQALDALL